MKFSIRAATAFALTIASVAATAEQRVGDTYVSPTLGYTWLDDDRQADDDLFYGIAIGHHFNEAVSLELNVNRGLYDLPADKDLRLTAISIDALHIFARDSKVSPFISLGAGQLYNSPEGARHTEDPLLQAGLGMMIELGSRDDGTLKFSLRPEVKARWSFPGRNDPQDHLLDYMAGIGFQLSFGSPPPKPVAAPEPPPPPPPPAPPPPPPPPADTDGDGVTDDLDKCPDTPRGVAVDAYGCPRRGSATLQGVNFEYNSATLTSESRPILAAVAADLKRYPRLKVELQGHTDSTGSDKYNLTLSQKRAQSVRDYLVSEGVGPQQLTAKGYGESDPIADNKTEAGRAENRRVAMVVLENPGEVKIDMEEPKK